MVLRDAGVTDIAALSDAWYAMLDETGMLAGAVDPCWPDLLAAHFSREIEAGRHVWKVVERDGRIVATGALFVNREPSIVALTGLGATLAGVYTYPLYRRRGYARTIATELVAFARTHGCRTIRLRATNAGRPLYEALGFRNSDEMSLAL